MIGLIIIIVFPFVYFYTQMNNLGRKTSAIKKALDEGKETYIDPLTGKTHWTENGEQVIRTTVNKFEKIPEGCIVGDRILQGIKSGKVYKNYSYENFIKHVQRQIDSGECWCFERSAYTNSNSDLRYNLKEKYFYTLNKKKNREFFNTTYSSNRTIRESKVFYVYYINKVISLNPYKTNTFKITEKEYKKLGGK